MDSKDRENRVAELLRKDPVIATWLEGMRATAQDAKGRTIVLGLTAEETEEFLRLNLTVNRDVLLGAEGKRIDPEIEQKRARYSALKEKLDDAISQDAAENLSFWSTQRSKQ